MKSEQKTNKKVFPKKSLGQNFLLQTGIIKKLAGAADIRSGDTILEIGPGTGNLTAELALTGNKIICVEKDPEMAATTKERFENNPNVIVSIGDALDFDETKIKPPYKIAANLPFYLTAPLIRKFLESSTPPKSMTVIVQKEVAQRINAAPPKMNMLAVSVQFYATVKIVSYVSKGCFWPIPKVDCAILHISLYAEGGERNNKQFVNHFFGIARAGFAQPRKQLAGNLAKGLQTDKKKIVEWLANNNIKPSQRPGALTIENWKKLTQTLPMDYNIQ